MAKITRPFVERIDERTTRKDRSRQAILQAYLELVNETRRQPTAMQIAMRAGCSLRLIFQHFSDLQKLTLATAQYAREQGRILLGTTTAEGDRPTRIKAQIERRARNCEAWLPLWRVVLAHQDGSDELRSLVGLERQATIDRLAMMYALELATLSEMERRRLLIALEAITDFECWGRLRDDYGFSVEQAVAMWMSIVDRLLPPTPAQAYAGPKQKADASPGPAMPPPGAARSSGSGLALAL